jgi:hypothetical protein
MVEMRAQYGGMRYTTVQTRFDGSTYAGNKTSALFFFVIIVFFLINHWPPLSPRYCCSAGQPARTPRRGGKACRVEGSNWYAPWARH